MCLSLFVCLCLEMCLVSVYVCGSLDPVAQCVLTPGVYYELSSHCRVRPAYCDLFEWLDRSWLFCWQIAVYCRNDGLDSDQRKITSPAGGLYLGRAGKSVIITAPDS